jgi:beta-mannosidase
LKLRSAEPAQNCGITLQSPKLARSVYISFGDPDVESSDNYFDLFPGEPATVTLNRRPQSISLELR